MSTREILYKIKSIVQDYDDNASIILFGSRARGDAKPDSDWDILILTSIPFEEKSKREIQGKLYLLELETDQVISTIIYSKDYWSTLTVTPLFQNIASEGSEI